MKSKHKNHGHKPSTGKPAEIKKDHGAIAKESNAALCRKIEVLELALKRACGSMAYNPPEHYIGQAKEDLQQMHSAKLTSIGHYE